MQIRITKGTFSLHTAIDTRDGRLRIGVKSIGCGVGFYNIYEDQICQWRRDGRNDTKFKIGPGFYSFKDLSKVLKRKVPGLNISLDKITGLIDLTVPANIDLWLTDAIKYMIGLDDDELADWLQVNMRETDLWNLYLLAAYLFIWMRCQPEIIYHQVNQEILKILIWLCNLQILSGTFRQ